MSKNENRLNFRMTDETAAKIERWYQEDNCRSKNEFIEKAVNCYPDIACPVCGGDVNSWDKRCSRALGYRQIVCEGCISEEYQVTVENLRYVMENHFGLVPCPGI